jgi:hypothetical protein
MQSALSQKGPRPDHDFEEGGVSYDRPGMSLPNRIDDCARKLEEHASPCRLRVTRLTGLPRTFPIRGQDFS